MKFHGKKMNRNKSNIFLFLCVNILLVLIIIALLINFIPHKDDLDNQVHAATVSREATSTAGMTLDTSSEALQSANNQLDDMNTGNIVTIDGNSPDFYAISYRDWKRGNIVYWELEDQDTTVFIRADTEEIIYYEHTGWVTGSMSENQILTQAATIAGQFDDLPSDKNNPEADLIDDLLSSEGYDATSQTFSTTNYPYWQVIYSRIKDNIIAEDHIKLLVLPNGYCSLYSKTWNMSLASFSTTYGISQTQAENIAKQFVGGDVTVHQSYKKIVRPTYFWTQEDSEYGNPPSCAYVIWIEDADGNLWIIYIDGNSSLNLGGDYAANYYAE